MEGEILMFFKFGSKENMMDLYKNGTIYLNTIDYFKNLEEQGLRGDDFEGTSFIKNYHEYKTIDYEIKFEHGKSIPINPVKLSVRGNNNITQGNIFSLFAIKTPDILDDNFKIDDRVEKFGSHCVVIKNLPYFLKLIKLEIDKLGLAYSMDVVNYYDKDRYNGDLSLFDKPVEFEYQKEYRIVVYNDKNKPLILSIGNMQSFSEIQASNIINQISD